MSQARFIVGDVFDVLATIADGSVDLVLTSPPFLALRSYLPEDHPDKAKEIGSEPTPAAFIDTMLALTTEWERLLAPHGSIAIELGDTYSGSTDRIDGDTKTQQRKGDGWPDAKSACLIPELYRVALAYGINPLTGAESPAGRWRVRNTVRWVRPNPPVGALGDKYRPATSEMVIACKSKDRWFDLDAVRTEPTGINYGKQDTKVQKSRGWMNNNTDESTSRHQPYSHPAGVPPLDWWNIPTHPYKGAHYATWPPELCRVPIESMCPRHVCTQCGQPRRRITGEPEYVRTDTDRVPARLTMNDGDRPADGVNQHTRDDGANTSVIRQTATLGWSCCGCGPGCTATHTPSVVTPADDLGPARKEPGTLNPGRCDDSHYRPGLVLDPFAGSGTTLAVATGHGRDAIGIDIDERNADLAAERVGMFLTVETTMNERSRKGCRSSPRGR